MAGEQDPGGDRGIIVPGPDGRDVVANMSAAARTYKAIVADLGGRGVHLDDDQAAELIAETILVEAGHGSRLDAIVARVEAAWAANGPRDPTEWVS